MKDERINTEVKSKILLVDDDTAFLRLMTMRLESEGYEVSAVDNGTQALRIMFQQQFHAVLSDLRMPGLDGLSLFDEILHRYDGIPVILMTAHGTIKDAIAATQRGVFGFLTKPIDHDELRATLDQAMSYRHAHDATEWCQPLITRSPEMLALLAKAKQAAATQSNIMMIGENGCGKRSLATAIHAESSRSDQALISLNCRSMSSDALNEQLFGSQQGNIPSALSLATESTLLLIDIGELNMQIQASLVDYLSAHPNVRIICTNVSSLFDLLAEQKFRQDLYYLLSVISIRVPPLAERFEDIPLIANQLLQVIRQHNSTTATHFSKDAMDVLCTCEWPGNVRQLNNVIEQCAVLSSTPGIAASLVHRVVQEQSHYWPTLTEARDEFEHRYLCRLLQVAEGKVTRAAELAGRNRTDMHKLIKKHDLNPSLFKAKHS